MNMERILALDVGEKRIGVAVSDLLGITAQGVKTIHRVGMKKDLIEIEALLKEYKPSKIVCGLPKNMDGSLGPSAEAVQKFAQKLQNKFGHEVIYVDERLTTVSAQRVLIEGDVSRKNRKNVVDKLAAQYILQMYLDSKGGA